MLNLLKKYTKHHQDILNRNAEPRFLIYSCEMINDQKGIMLMGGFADRLCGIVGACLFAILTNRALIIEWKTPGKLSKTLVPNTINWTFNPYEIIPYASIGGVFDLMDAYDANKNAVRSKDIEAELFKDMPYVILYNNADYIEDLMANPHYKEMLSGLTQAPDPRAALYSMLYSNLFSLQVPQAYFDRELGELLETVKRCYTVGIHLRIGGDGDWVDPELLPPDKFSDFLDAAYSIVSHRDDDNWAVYLATDSQKLKDKIMADHAERFEGRLLCSTSPIMHIDRQRTKLDMMAFGQIIAISEHFLLSNCDLVLSGPGRYAKTAAWIGQKEVREHPNLL
jgi:hypothetical protein